MTDYIRLSIDNKSQFSTFEMLGFASHCMLFDQSCKTKSIETTLSNIQLAIHNDSILFLFDWNKNPICFLAYTYLSSKIIDSLQDRELNIYDWSTGDNFYVVSIFCKKGYFYYIKDYLKQLLSEKSIDKITWKSKSSKKILTISLKEKNTR